MKLDPEALQAATEAYTAAREEGTPIIDTFPALILAYLQHAGKGVEGDDDDRTLASACRKYNIGSVSRLDEIIATLRALQHAGEAEPVAWMKPPHAAAVEPHFVRAEERTHDWQKSVFTIPLFAAPHPHQVPEGALLPDVDDLAQIIRRVDGGNMLGAGELAERILRALRASPSNQASASADQGGE